VTSSRGLAGQYRRNRWMALLVVALAPLAMGGCPEFQNQSVQAMETAVRGVVDAGVTLIFDQFRSSSAR